ALSRYDDFHKKYIHKSHSPFNATVGMAPQIQDREMDSDLENFVADQVHGFELTHCFRREIFWNEKQCTHFINPRPSVLCHLQFVSRENPGDTFPEGVEIEVWDNDLCDDDRLGAARTDAQGRVSLLCFDLSEKPDLFFTFHGEGKRFTQSGEPLPAHWESWDEKCLLDPVSRTWTKGRFPNVDDRTLGSLELPRQFFVQT
ncbi:MAG: hypothetical protein MI747_07255, partial [Desulfobacterales bacterium]|nr:hypothetical protein [Desulfobacterales bacterium]